MSTSREGTYRTTWISAVPDRHVLRCEADVQGVVVEVHLQIDRRRQRAMGGDAAHDPRCVMAHQPVVPLDHHLRRVEPPAVRRLGIGFLPRGEGWAGEGILPAQIIPVIDVQRERDHPRLLGELAQQRIGGRAGRAALAGEKLDHHRRGLGADRPAAGRATRGQGRAGRGASGTFENLPARGRRAKRRRQSSLRERAAP